MFPPPGKTSGDLHDRLCRKYPGKAILTLGYGPDFAVLCSRGVLMNIPWMVRDIDAPLSELIKELLFTIMPDLTYDVRQPQ